MGRATFRGAIEVLVIIVMCSLFILQKYNGKGGEAVFTDASAVPGSSLVGDGLVF